ncbi:MAG TPA: DUF2115 family protein [Methanocorpusculum sp.]|nr:DUF2115 family protein [Methanocorpusculum sp.]
MSFWNRAKASSSKNNLPSFESLADITKKGRLLKALKKYASYYNPDDLEEMLTNYSNKLKGIPHGYSAELKESAKIQITDGYHRLMTKKLDSAHSSMRLRSDWKDFVKYAAIETSKEDSSNHLRILKLIIAAYISYIEEEPIHPVNTKFPDGSIVEKYEGIYYCPVKDRWNNIESALCRYCPAVQSRERDLILSKTERELISKEEKLENYFYNFKG